MSLWLLGPMGGKVGKVGKGTCVQTSGGFPTFATFPPIGPRGKIRRLTVNHPSAGE
jgi:hypothetical protein